MTEWGGRVDTRSVLFTDLVGSTELRVELGEEAADALRRRHDELLTTTITTRGGTVIKGLGDGVLATFTAAADAVAAAVAIQQAVHAEPFGIRIGLSSGDVSVEHDDVFGVPVVEASRLCAVAAAGEILAAELVRVLARGRGGFVFEPMGDLELKGLPEPVPSTRVIWEPLVDTTSTESTDDVPLPAALLLSGISPSYVGRPELLSQLDEHWSAVTQGTTRAVLLAGEPGVGKTRTAAELARRVHQQQGLVLYGRCEEGLGAPYQPFVEVLDWYTAHATNAPTLGRLPGELTRLLPDLGRRVDNLPPATPSDPGSEEHRLFEATTSWLVDLARQPDSPGVLLVLDDLHWATKPTLLLTLHLLRAASEQKAPLLTVVTYRDTDIDRAHPLSSLVGDLRRLPGVERIAVDNLSRPEALALMETAAGHELDEVGHVLADAIYAETEGNPFFVTEVLRHLVETGAVKREGERFVTGVDVAQVSIPEGVRDVIGRRLSRLSDATNEVLSTGAVVGRDLDVDVLVALTDAGEDAVLDALDEAARARLVEETGVDRFRFSHALVRTTIYEELSATRRRRLHRRIADAIEKLRPDDYVALAYHCAEGGPEGGDVSRAVRYGLAAAEQSLAGRAFADAESRFNAVLELLEDAEEADPPERVAALVGLGEAQRDQGNPAFRETLLHAAHRARDLGLTEWLVRAALSNSRGLVSVVGQLDAARIEIIEDALEAIGPSPTADRARVVAQLASEVSFGGNNKRRLALCDEAEAIARQLHDEDLLAWVLTRLGPAALDPARGDQMLETAAECVALADGSGDPSNRVLARMYLSSALIFAGRIDEADALADEMQSIATEASLTVQWLARGMRVKLAYTRGTGVAEAEQANNEFLAFGQETSQTDAFMWWGAGQAGVGSLRGESANIAEAAGMFADQYPLAPTWRSGHAWMVADAGRLDDARAIVEQYDLRNNTMEHEPLPLCGTWQLGVLAFLLDDVDLARRIDAVLSKYIGKWAHYIVFTFGPVSLPLGLTKSVQGKHDEAVALVESALADLERTNSMDLHARLRLHFAEVLRRRGAAGDEERARDELLAARARAEAMPALQLVARIDTLLATS